MDERELLIYLHSMNRIGWKTIEKLYTSLDSLLSLFDLSPLELSMLTGIELKFTEQIHQHLSAEKQQKFHTDLLEWEMNGIQIITVMDEMYPLLLKEIAQPPWVLYAIGNLDLLSLPTLAIVGTRNPTTYGVQVAEKLSKELALYGWVIVSGMARGIDRIAHEMALDNNGNTIAVLGSGIDVIYPKENARLYKNLSQKGLILSEYSPGIKPAPGLFPQRNRIISGISYGSIVVEASIKSGSLITVQHALDQSREVFAVPGPITSKQSHGTNSIIQQGAKLIQTVEDIIHEFPYLLDTIKATDTRTPSITLSKSEQAIYSLIHEKIHIDQILGMSNLSLSNVYECLLSLQLKGLIKQMPGGYYRKKA